eukprot:992071_1
MEPFLSECTQDTVCIVSISLIGIVTFLVVPFSIYCTYKFHSFRHDEGISHRYPAIVIQSSILNILYMFIVVQYLLIEAGISDQISLWFAPIIGDPLLILIILVNLFRLWLIHYDVNWNSQLFLSQHKWQTILGSTVNDEERYVRNRDTWGNWRWLRKILFFLWLFFSILCITPQILQHTLSTDIHIDKGINIGGITYTATVVFLLLFAITIWHKMPAQFVDTFRILKEIKIIILSSIILCIIWFCLLLKKEDGNLFHIMQIVCLFSFVFNQIFVCEFLVIRMIRKTRRRQDTRSNTVGNRHEPFNILFPVIMASDIGIEQYAQHLGDTFSLENLLFIIEMLQWLYALEWDRYNILPMHKDSIQYRFADVIPLSSINKENVHWFIKFEKIYHKYVSEAAGLQINVPHCILMAFVDLLYLWDMKQQIEQETYQPKWIKKKPAKSTMRSQSSMKRLFSLRSIRTTKRSKTNVIEEQKTDKKKPLTVIKRTETAPPVKDIARASVTIGGFGDIQELQDTQSNTNYTITQMEEKEHKEAQGGINVDDLYMGVIQDTGDQSHEHNIPKMKSVSFADSVDAGHRKGDTSGFIAKMPSIPSITNDSEYHTIEHQIKPPMNCGQSVDTVIVRENTGATQSTSDGKSVEFDAQSKLCGKSVTFQDESDDVKTEEDSNKLGDFLTHVRVGIESEKEEKKKHALGVHFTPLETKTSSHSHQSTGSRSNLMTLQSTLEDAPIPMDVSMGTSMGNLTITGSHSIRTMETAEWNANAKKNLYSKRRSGRSGVSSFIGQGLSKLGGLFTPRSTTKRSSVFMGDEADQSQYEMDPGEVINMEKAKKLDLQDFISVACRALKETLNLSHGSLMLFKTSDHWKKFNDKVDLEELVKERREELAEMMKMNTS